VLGDDGSFAGEVVGSVSAAQEAAQDHVEHGDEEQVEGRGESTAADDGGANGTGRPRAPRPGGEDQRKHAEMKANEVMRMGRRRSSAASIAASAMGGLFCAICSATRR